MRKRDRSGHCIKCGAFRNGLHRDHIIPKSKGGADEDFNIQHLCANCHEDKTSAENKSAEYREYRSRQNKSAWEEGRNKGSRGLVKGAYAHAPKSQSVRDKISISVLEGHRIRREREAALPAEERALLSEERSERKRADHRRRKERKAALALQQQLGSNEVKQVH